MDPEQPAKRTPRIVSNRQHAGVPPAEPPAAEPDVSAPAPAERPPAVGYRAGAEVPADGADGVTGGEPPPGEEETRSWERPQLRGSHPGDRYVRVIHHAPMTRPGVRRAPVCGPALPPRTASPFVRWLLQGQVKEMDAPYEQPHAAHTHPWWKVMSITSPRSATSRGSRRWPPGRSRRSPRWCWC